MTLELTPLALTDVAWASYSLLKKIENEVECSIAPEIYIEVLSCLNAKQEINEKKVIYFEQGAMELWCDSFENISFFVKEGRIEHSRIAKKFR